MIEGIWMELALVIDGASFYFFKRFCLTMLLWGIAVIDWRECRIPNRCIAVGVLIKFLITILEIISKKFVIEILFLEITAATILVIGSLGCRLIMKNSIGAGDIKLLMIMALFLDWQEIWRTVFLSLVVFMLITIGMIITNKKSKGDSIPFAPAFAIGTCLTCFLS